MNHVLWSSASEEWATPQPLFDALDSEFCFTLDPCATELNHKCEKYFTKEQNGLNKSWKGETVFCNPPYGRQIGKWVEKAFTESEKGTVVVLLVPSRTDTKWFHDFILGKAEIRFLKGRLKFGGHSNPAPFPSMIAVYRKTEMEGKE